MVRIPHEMAGASCCWFIQLAVTKDLFGHGQCNIGSMMTSFMQGLFDVQVAITRPQVLTAEEQVDEAVFQQAFIPRKLEEVEHFERDSERLVRGENKDIYFQTLTGMASDGTGAGVVPKVLLHAANSREGLVTGAGDGELEGTSVSVSSVEVGGERSPVPAVPQKLGRVEEDVSGEDESASDGESVSGSEADSSTDEVGWEERPVVSAEEAKEARKANKKAVKEQQREKRLTKLPKKAKKRAEKKGKVKK